MAAPATVAAPARVTLAQFREMDLDDHAELILGRILEPMPESFRHVDATDRLQQLFANRFSPNWVLRNAPLPIVDDGMPRPDALVFREAKTVYQARGGYDARDVVLVAEVCLSSKERDYELKDEQYALGGIPEYWIVDLGTDRVEVRTEPHPWGYARRAVYARGETVSGLAVAEILGETYDRLDA